MCVCFFFWRPGVGNKANAEGFFLLGAYVYCAKKNACDQHRPFHDSQGTPSRRVGANGEKMGGCRKKEGNVEKCMRLRLWFVLTVVKL